MPNSSDNSATPNPNLDKTGGGGGGGGCGCGGEGGGHHGKNKNGCHKHDYDKHFNEAAKLNNRKRWWFRGNLTFLIIALLVVIGTDLFLHLLSSPDVLKELPHIRKFSHIAAAYSPVFSRLRLDPTNTIELEEDGRLHSLSETDLQWYLGKKQGSLIAQQFRDRDTQIRDIEDRVIRRSLLEFKVKFTTGLAESDNAALLLTQLDSKLSSNDFGGAAGDFTQIVQGWSEETRKFVGEPKIFELNYGLAELARLKDQQVKSRGANLLPPRMHQIFWSSPIGALCESIFWALLGTLVNMIVSISQARVKGRYTTDQMAVVFSKLFYGPVLSLVLILFIYFGLIDTGTEARFWLLPLIAFLLGYNTRKLALVIDRLSDKVFSRVTKSIDDGAVWEGKAVGHAAMAVEVTQKPKSLAEVKTKGLRVAHAYLTSALIKRQKDLS